MASNQLLSTSLLLITLLSNTAALASNQAVAPIQSAADLNQGAADQKGADQKGADQLTLEQASPSPSETQLTDERSSANQSILETKATSAESMQTSEVPEAIITNDIVIFGILMAILALVFYTNASDRPAVQRFYKICPAILLCYFLPSLLTMSGLVDPELSQIPSLTKNCLLPTSLVLLTLCTDLREVLRLGPKALIMFLTGTVGVVLGGPIAILLAAMINPELIGGTGADEVWRGLATVAGSWIGGSANMVAMKELFEPSESLYSVMIAVDIFVAELWMVFLLLGVGKADWIDKKFAADNSSINQLQKKMETYSLEMARVPTLNDFFLILATGFGITAICHLAADAIGPWIEATAPSLMKFSLHSPFFWLIVLATLFGLTLSFTPARKLDGAGASKIGTVCIFILVASIGLKMNLLSVLDHPGLFLVGTLWMLFHVILLLIVGRLIRAPYFYLAVGSKANIGGAASAPIIAAAFHPSLAPVGVLLAVVGYALGTFGAYLCAILMQIAAGVAS